MNHLANKSSSSSSSVSISETAMDLKLKLLVWYCAVGELICVELFK